jgi:hypothetical protein
MGGVIQLAFNVGKRAILLFSIFYLIFSHLNILINRKVKKMTHNIARV